MNLENRHFLAPFITPMPKRCNGKMLDFDKALELIKENEGKEIRIGLAEDWYCTSGKVESDGRISYDEYESGGCLCLASRWATPVVEIDEEVVECWKESDGTVDAFNSEEKWKRFFKANR